MFNFSNRQFVFKQTSGALWNFYSDTYTGLSYCSLTKRNTWSEAISLQRNILKGFHVDIDDEDYFHILFEDSKGNIFYTKLDDNINTIPVLSSKIPLTQNKHLFLIPNKNNVLLFYVLPHNNSFILAQQVIHDNKASSPMVIDYIINNNRPFSVVTDKTGTIYLFYQASDGKYSQIGFKKLTENNKKWSEFSQVSRFEGNCEYVSTVIDNKDIIHASYQRYKDKQYELVYQQKISDRPIWTNEVVIQTSPLGFENSFIILVNGSIIIYWIREDNIYYSTSNDSGSTWSKPQRYNFPAVKQLLCIFYKSNTLNETKKVSAGIFPGSFVNGLKLAFYLDSSNNNLTADELKNLLIDGLKLLKGNVEELKENEVKSKDDILMLDKTLKSYEKELIKYSVKLGMIENELDQLNINVDRFEKYRELLDKLEERFEKEEIERLSLSLQQEERRSSPISFQEEEKYSSTVPFQEEAEDIWPVSLPEEDDYSSPVIFKEEDENSSPDTFKVEDEASSPYTFKEEDEVSPPDTFKQEDEYNSPVTFKEEDEVSSPDTFKQEDEYNSPATFKE